MAHGSVWDRTLKRATEGIVLLSTRGRRKLSKNALSSMPQEIIEAFARLPRVFKKWDIDRVLGDRISRSMKWRYLQRMEKLGLVKHSSKKCYRKTYDRVSDWLERDLVPRIRRTEFMASLPALRS
jgi:hypothetical protein